MVMSVGVYLELVTFLFMGLQRDQTQTNGNYLYLLRGTPVSFGNS